ncbi:hypothetical protein LMJ38_35010 [Streptomyces sp. R1]|uniref:hypothetical protein n=1 Tax=Streptomyces sp. R1 TaxID=1509279 RepID=UPI001E550AE1|nr:hypothetical protein [Streptomyces sp. R1]MCC8341103.1 hypothetical protein [Streptomyces sp. R1]
MTRHLLLVLALLLLVAECVAQFVAHDQTFTVLFALVGIAAMVVRWAISPQASTEDCPADCPKCRESASMGGGEL